MYSGPGFIHDWFYGLGLTGQLCVVALTIGGGWVAGQFLAARERKKRSQPRQGAALWRK